MRTEAQVAAMSCPVCRVPLAMSDREGIEIDYCPQCRGIWLDRGELDKIIERSAPAEAPAPAPPSGSSAPPNAWAGDDFRDSRRGYGDHSHGKPHYKKRKSWLSELFDD